MSQFKLSVIRKDGMQHESTFAGWNAERAMTIFSKEAREDAKSLFVAIFEGAPEPIAAEGGIKPGSIVWSVYGTYTASKGMPGEAPSQSSAFGIADDPTRRLTPVYSIGDYVAIVGKDCEDYGHNGKIVEFVTVPASREQFATLELTTGPRRGKAAKLSFADIRPE